jgi:hypothetical protein
MGFMHAAFSTKDGTMRYMHCGMEVSNEDIEESNGEDSKTIKEQGTQSPCLKKVKILLKCRQR